MKFCCEKFQTHWQFHKRSYPNIRIVRFTSEWLPKTMPVKDKYKNSSYRFYITWGYDKDFSFDLITLFIEYCPFCGTDLYKFYKSDEYANEIEGKTFKL